MDMAKYNLMTDLNIKDNIETDYSKGMESIKQNL